MVRQPQPDHPQRDQHSLNDTKESNDAAADAEGEAVEARKAEVLDLPTMAETTH